MSHCLPFVTCLPLIESDIPAVLELDQRCLGGLWTHSGYQRELESDCSDLLVLVASAADLSRVEALSQIRAKSPSRVVGEEAVFNDVSPRSEDVKDMLLLGVGCLWAILEEAHITTLVVEPSTQGQKLGQLLLSALLMKAQHRGLTRATLEVRASNEKALGLYQKFGFKEAGQRKRYYSDGENARILWRSGLQEEAFAAEIERLYGEAIAQLSAQGTTIYCPSTSADSEMF